MEQYLCKECRAPATVDPAGIHRTCTHTGTVLLDMQVTCYGEGHVFNRPRARLEKMVDLICRLVGLRRG